MLIKLETNVLSIALFLVLWSPNALSATVKTLNQTVIDPRNPRNPRNRQTPVPLANDRDEVVIPILSSNPRHNPTVPYYRDAPNYPHVQLGDNFDRQPPHPFLPESPEPQPKRRKRNKLKPDRRLSSEEPDYDYNDDNYSPPQSNPTSERPNKKPNKKMMKAIERVYFYPEDTDSDIKRNKKKLKKMKDYMNVPASYEPYYDAEDVEDTPFQPIKKDNRQMKDNPPRGEHEESDETAVDPTQSSIANDVKQFGKEAVDEALRFEKFLDNLKHFTENSEKEYAPEDQGHSEDSGEQGYPSEDTNFGQRRRNKANDENPVYTESMAALPYFDDSGNNDNNNNNDNNDQTRDRTRDRTRDYERVNNYGHPDEYDSERDSYQDQRDQIQRDDRRSGHRYHKDRRRRKGRRPVVERDEEYETRDKEISSLIDQEPDERDYLTNFDVVKQLKNSEKKYNIGADPVYSSQRDFDEVTRLEKMIENVALLNKEKEKRAARNHDRREHSEESKKVATVVSADNATDTTTAKSNH